ncbi:MAG: hypothetical protein IPO40_13335 [Fibrobacteres bacterium]|nr:hypothetical protein [Fibrobacterota bacterium]
MTFTAALISVLGSLSSIEGKLDIAAGPSFHQLGPAVADVDPWITGFNLDLGVAVSNEVARSKAPKRYRKMIPKKGEMVVRPIWVAVVPRQVLLSPGGNLSVYGAAWELLGVGTTLELVPGCALAVSVDLPEITWLHVGGPYAQGPENVIGVGISPDAHLQIDPASWLRLDAGWAHHVDYASDAFRIQGRHWNPWNWGSAYVQLHLRPGIHI